MRLEFLPTIQRKVQKEITEDRQNKRKAFAQSLEDLRFHVEQRCEDPNDSDIAGFEKNIWSLLMKVGLQIVLLYLASKRQPPNKRRMKGADGHDYKYIKEKTYEVRSIFGEEKYMTSQYQRGENKKKDLCLTDGQVGLLPAGGLSPNLALEVAQLSTRMAYEQVEDVMKMFRPYVPSKRSICGIIDLVGAHAEAILDQTPCESGDTVVIQVDARGAPRISPEEYEKRCKPHKKGEKSIDKDKGRRRRIRPRDWSQYKKQERKRRLPGEKAHKTKRVTVGLIYALNRCDNGSWEGGYGKFFARFGSAEDVFKRLKATLDSMGDTVKKVIFISDGDPHYRRLQSQYFPEATAVIDFYHVSEYLWKAGEARFKEGSDELSGFVSQLKEMLLNGETRELLSVLRTELEVIPQRGFGTKGRRQRMLATINYISKRTEQMPYKWLREQGLEIASGAIEGAVRQIVAIRLDGSGMRWGEHRPQLILNMICLRLSGAWDMFSHAIVQWAHQYHLRGRMTPVGVNVKSSAPVATKNESSHPFTNEKVQNGRKAA